MCPHDAYLEAESCTRCMDPCSLAGHDWARDHLVQRCTVCRITRAHQNRLDRSWQRAINMRTAWWVHLPLAIWGPVALLIGSWWLVVLWAAAMSAQVLIFRRWPV